ncbi:MAG: dipeptide/oligopeptide/nickel ABC transporter ATP-binding protein [Parachlamydiales bacterium]|jgi:peptide/nickel transport system ATP-binding protein
MTPLLVCKQLSQSYALKKNKTEVLSCLSLALEKGRTTALIGRSGAGKTTLAKTILRLVPASSGKVFFEGREILGLPFKDFHRLRLKMQMVFQNPASSLNPHFTVKELLKEPFLIHRIKAECKIKELLEQVRLPLSCQNQYPHELSGGGAQRVALARALALKPSFLILDEPFGALDLAMQFSTISLLKELQKAFVLTYLFISHDLAMVRAFADRIAVLQNGRIVENQPAPELFRQPKHRYTQELLQNAALRLCPTLSS